MRRTLALFAVVLALAAWSVAQAPGSNPHAGQITVVAGPIPQNVTDNAATIWWETSAPAETIVKYGTDQNNLAQTAQQPYGQQSHSVQLSNLQPNTTYFFQVQRAGGEVLKQGQFHTEERGFTQNQAVRIIQGPNIEFIGHDSAVIAWSTNAPSGSIVRYGTDPNNLGQTAQQKWGDTTHRVTIRNLQPGGTYYFIVESGQAQGTGSAAKSQTAMFQTVGDASHALRPMIKK